MEKEGVEEEKLEDNVEERAEEEEFLLEPKGVSQVVLPNLSTESATVGNCYDQHKEH